MDRKRRIANLETRIMGDRVSWKLKDGTDVAVDPWDLMDCLVAVMRKDYHPLLEKIREANLSTYTGDDALMSTLHAFCNSDEYYFKH